MGARPPLTYTMGVPLSLSESERTRVGEAAIDYMRSRAQRGRGVGNKRLRGPDGDGKYASSYVNSSEFKATGKTAGRVNLTFSGQMLFSMEVQDVSRPGQVVIGFSDEDSNDKAVFLQEKNYDWFGLDENERRRIISNFVGGTEPSIDPGFVSDFLRGILAVDE